jgi:hypothetical protein
MVASFKRRARFLLVTLGIICSGCAHRIELQKYAGKWVLQSSGQDMMLLSTAVRQGRIRGTLIHPEHFTEDSRGEFCAVSGPTVTRLVSGKLRKGTMELEVGTKPDVGSRTMVLSGTDHASLSWAQGLVPAWRFSRIQETAEITVSSRGLNTDPITGALCPAAGDSHGETKE